MTVVPPHPTPSQVLPYRSSRWIFFFALVGALSIGSVLWSCTAEPPATPSGSTGATAPVASGGGPSGNHPPSIRTARIYPVDVTVETELRVETQSEDADGDRITYRYQWFVNGVPATTAPAFKTESLRKGDRITAEVIPNRSEEHTSELQSPCNL